MPGRLVTLPSRSDARGTVTFLEGRREMPFDVRLVYYIHGVPAGKRRGDHAHRRLQELLIAVSGGLTVGLDDGRTRSTHRMESPNQGLLIDAMTWIELSDFAPGTVCLLLASQPYDESDNIRDRAEFDRLAARRSHD